MEFIATCPKGFERLLADELISLHIPQVRPLRGQVSFGASLEDAYRVCLWSRLASRVLLILGRLDAHDSDALYQGVASIDWCEHIPEGATFAVDAHGTNDQLRNSQFVALRTKDAIVDVLTHKRGRRPLVDTQDPGVHIDIRLTRERATLSLNLSGEPLFRRGYGTRAPKNLAPLRPDYAAALLFSAAWWRLVRRETPTLVVLWAGQGSLLVEAAQIAYSKAPSLLRQKWGSSAWSGHIQDVWDALVSEAQELSEKSSQRALNLIVADGRPGAQEMCRKSLGAAGIHTTFQSMSVQDACVYAKSHEDALVVADLSWVRAAGLAQEAQALTSLSAAAGLDAAVLGDGTNIEVALRQKAKSSFDVMIGKEPAQMRVFAQSDELDCVPTVSIRQVKVPVFVAASDQFAARLSKVAKQRAKWARREDVSCYRVYDADLPDYAVSIDLFGESIESPKKKKGRWLQISEYTPPKEIDSAKARSRLMDVLTLAPQIFEVRPQDVFVRVRTRARGGSQYADEGSAPTSIYHSRSTHERTKKRGPYLPEGAHLIDEGGLVFEVNFSTRLDCGIFLDHRDTRSLIREMAKQTKGSKRFLNLFAYTGTATCYAADGGAKYTTTVDLSRPTLDWAERNMSRNGFEGNNHEFVQADVLSWVNEQRHSANRWDLIFCDVPTFSNSRRMRKASFDVQRDHAELLIGVSRLLTRSGKAIFSCNLRSFKPDIEKLARAGVVLEDITAQTIPEDFARNQKIHHCYIVQRG